ncbi:MAG: sorbosone dehydrogenase family protein [Betaproteobacteria bacterium]|nr:MAG: sorbosone dehydrogenase family protein [Betaproteobacteria bacterium]
MRFDFTKKSWRFIAVVATLSVNIAASQSCAAQSPTLDQIKLPPGFSIELVARVPSARAMTWGDRGTLFVGSSAGNVYALTFAAPNAGGQASVHTIASGLRDPGGVAFHNGALFVSAVSRVLRFDDIEHRVQSPPEPVVVTDKLPSDGHHGRKFIAFGPDGKLYVNVGAPCNICEPDPERYAHIERMNADGSGRETVARGVRNSVGFDWDPRTKELWFTDNGRDMLGDDVPPDELNHVTKVPQHFGYPYCHGGDISDPEFGKQHPCSEFVPPARKLGPHVASLGMRFYTGTQFPTAFRNQIFIAEHGSWNRSQKIGYRVTLVRLDAAGKAVAYEPFAEGWLQGDRVWGRPADVSVAPDGSLFVSDDTAGAIYRIRYRG